MVRPARSAFFASAVVAIGTQSQRPLKTCWLSGLRSVSRKASRKLGSVKICRNSSWSSLAGHGFIAFRI